LFSHASPSSYIYTLSLHDALPILRSEIRVFRNNVQSSRNRPLVQVRVNSSAKVLSNELVRPLVLVDNFRLPGKVIRDDVVLEVLPLQPVAGIENAVRCRKVLPRVNQLSPINEAPDLVDRIRCLVFLLQALHKRGSLVRRGNAARKGLIVDLVANHRRMVFEMTDDLADDAFG